MPSTSKMIQLLVAASAASTVLAAPLPAQFEERGALSSIFGDAAGEEIENVLKTAVLGSAVGAGVTGAVKGVQSLTQPKTQRDLEARGALSSIFGDAAGEEIENVLKTAVLGSAVGAGVTGTVNGVKSLTQDKSAGTR
ncbi:hypothetical protein BV25DRAFT_1915076, partial [Artomyces pyxidatus]